MADMFQPIDSLVDEIKGTTRAMGKAIFTLPRFIFGIILISGLVLVVKTLI